MPRKPVIVYDARRKLTTAEHAFLMDEEVDESEIWASFTLDCYRRGLPGRDTEQHPKALWEEFKAECLPMYIKKNPGQRPVPWWLYEAPEQRKRLGGTGTPDFEVLNVYPTYEKGVPCMYITKSMQLYYTQCNSAFPGVAIDPENPPVYETELEYLQRLNLLTPGEKKALKLK